MQTQLVLMTSCQIRVGPNPMTNVFIRTENRDRERTDPVATEADFGVINQDKPDIGSLQARECQGLPVATRRARREARNRS